MPPVREEQWKKSFDKFIDRIVDNFYPGLQTYTLTGRTENKTLSKQVYEVTFPKEIVNYYVDIFVAGEDGVIHPPGPVMKTQQLPTMAEFIIHVTNYFKNYELTVYGKRLSYVEISHFQTIDNTEKWGVDEVDNEVMNNYDSGYVVIMNVVYNKGHLPFPAILRSPQQIEQTCKRLKIENRELTENLQQTLIACERVTTQYDTLRRKLSIERRTLEDKYKNMLEIMEQKYIKLYGEKEVKEDCPVCYEVIPADNLKVPGCGHLICSSCYPRCAGVCPMCRENYVT